MWQCIQQELGGDLKQLAKKMSNPLADPGFFVQEATKRLKRRLGLYETLDWVDGALQEEVRVLTASGGFG